MAREAAAQRAHARAEQLCKGFAATATPQIWHCKIYDGSIGCGYEGDAVCEVEERRVIETESSCDTPPVG